MQLPDQDESQYNQLYMPLAVSDPVETTLTVSDEGQIKPNLVKIETSLDNITWHKL